EEGEEERKREPRTSSLGAFLGVGDEGGDKHEGEEEHKPLLPNDFFLPPKFPKNTEDSAYIKNAILTNLMFQSLPDKTLDSLVLAFEKIEYRRRSVVISQGDANIDYFYLLADGECSVTIDGKTLAEPYGTLSAGTLFGELAMLYNVPRAATVEAKTDCVLYRVNRRTFKYFLNSQQPQEREDVKAELREIDSAIDKIAGVKTRYSGSIIRPYKPQRWWLWRRWRGTVLQHAYKGALVNMALTAIISIVIGRRADCTWDIAMAPDQSHPIISRMAAFGKHWHYLQSITTFILTFFLSQSYALWRETYSAARKIQGRMNDVGLLLATSAARNETGYYTPEAEAVLDDVGNYSRLFHAFLWAKFVRSFGVLLSPRGMSRMLSRGLMTQAEFNAFQNIDQRAGASNACLEWMTIRSLKGIEEGHIRQDSGMRHLLLSKISELRGTFAGIGDILDGRIPLAYTHIVQILVDSFLASAPIALYAELGVWSILAVGVLTLFYSGLLDLAKIFLDPLDNDSYSLRGLANDSSYNGINMDIGVLIREGNAGSTRWKSGATLLPFEVGSRTRDIVHYRSIVFYDQLGCGKADEPKDISLYSIEDSVSDLKALLKKLGVRRFHLYGQSYGGTLAFEYMKSAASNEEDDVKCLSAILSGAPTNIRDVEEEFDRLLAALTQSSGKDDITDAELNDLFRINHQCRLPEMPKILADAYESAGTVWRGTDAIRDYVAEPPPEDAKRMPSTLIMRGEHDFVSEKQVQTWKDVHNSPFVRHKTLEGCSHHAMLENGAIYGEIVDSYFAEYD
ncbi:hypothetical protein ACHAXT_011431, partial [Thalassiosira profunda]